MVLEPHAMADGGDHTFVLVAEDDEEMRYLLVRALRRDGYVVVGAEDGDSLRSAVISARQGGREPDLIVSDLRMPGLGGAALMRWLSDAGCAPRTILVSAFVDEATRASAAALGIARMIEKPFDLDSLRGLVADELRAQAGA
jgi:two-component system response regulator MtrA